MENIVELIRLVSGRLEEAAQSDVVVGQIIDLGAVKIVPLSRLSVGLGVGGGAGEGEMRASEGRGKDKWKGGRGKGIGAGSGMGARVRPVGVAIFTEDGVEVLPIADKKGILDKIFDYIPKVIELVENATERKSRGAERKLEASPAREPTRPA